MFAKVSVSLMLLQTKLQASKQLHCNLLTFLLPKDMQERLSGICIAHMRKTYARVLLLPLIDC